MKSFKTFSPLPKLKKKNKKASNKKTEEHPRDILPVTTNAYEPNGWALQSHLDTENEVAG